MISHISQRPRKSSLSDRAKVRGVKERGKNRRRPSPRPRAALVGRVALTLAGLGAIGWGGYESYAFAMTSERFSIDDVVVTGHHRATSEAVVKLSGIRRGDNIFSIDLDHTMRTIAAHPWVASADVTRSYPSGIEIEVVEHEPVVLVTLGHLYYSDQDGRIIKRYAPGENEGLPVVTGLTRDEMETDDGEARKRLVGAIDFLTSDGVEDIDTVHLDPALGLSFVEGGVTVVVGHPPFTKAIARYAKVKSALAERKVKATRIVLGTSFDRRRDRAVARLEGLAANTGGK